MTVVAMRSTLEDLFCAPKFGGVDGSPLQRAICRAADGRPLAGALGVDEVKRFFGTLEIPQTMPHIVEVVAGVRGGKTLLAISALIKSALAADMSKVQPGEPARAVIVSPHMIATEHTFTMLRAKFKRSPSLERLIVDEGENKFVVRRPDGHVVEFLAVAANRSGVTLRGTWLTGFVLEEVAAFGSELAGYETNAEELLRAAEPRLLPGGQGWIISSPRGPKGLLFDVFTSHFDKPGRVLVVHAPTLAMNPTFDPAEVEALRARDPDAAAREYDAAWIDASTSFLESAAVDASTRARPIDLPPEYFTHVAAMDPATRGNAWTLVIGRWEGNRFRVVVAREWKGSKSAPLDTLLTLIEIKAHASMYGVRSVATDQWSSDALQSQARTIGLTLHERTITSGEKYALFDNLRDAMRQGQVELPPLPMMRADLVALKKVITPTGMRIEQPTSGAGRHCDFASSLVLALAEGRSFAGAATYGDNFRHRSSPALNVSYVAHGSMFGGPISSAQRFFTNHEELEKFRRQQHGGN